MCSSRTLREVQTARGLQIEYLWYLRELLLDPFDLRIPRTLVTTLLIRVLGIQLESETGDGTWNIKEMVVLCGKLLTSTLSAGFPNAVSKLLNQAVDA
jgi:hypothetical protein